VPNYGAWLYCLSVATAGTVQPGTVTDTALPRRLRRLELESAIRENT
jgi:hypothetical protein